MVLIIIGSFLVVLAALELRRRARKKRAAGGRYRAAVGGLNLDRGSARGASRKSSESRSLAGPIVLGLVTAVLCLWLAASYLLPEGEGPGPSLTMDNQAEAAQPEVQTGTLAGTLSAKNAAEARAEADSARADQAARAGASTAALPPQTSLASAAKAVTFTGSRWEQLGTMPGRGEAQPAAQARPASPSPAPPASQAAQAKTGQATPAPAKPPASKPEPAADAPARVSASLPAAASASAPAPRAAAPTPSRPAPATPGGRSFTVHLASFGESANAEKYQAQLIAAGESAFVSKTTVDGREWHRVMSGRFNSRAEADSHGRDLKRRGLTVDRGSFLVKPLD